MQENQIKPEKITKPIQLLAVWLIGLILLVGSLLSASATIKSPDWLPAFFAISAVTIIPVFLFLIFMLQTKFRPEMQEDLFYSKYLDKNTMTFEYADRNDSFSFETTKLREEIISISEETKRELENVKKLIDKDGVKTKEETEIETIIENSDNRLEQLKAIVKLASIDLRINVSLPKYVHITQVVQKIGFTKYTEFGHKKGTPEMFLASFGKKIPLEIIRDLVFDLIPYGLTHIKEVANVSRLVQRSNTIFLGSYSLFENNIKVDDELINKLHSINPDTDFYDIFER
ncbi:MAG TPA: hypothetical protein VL443_03320 [Cyclobacteriaceae bacterium]|jgi:hypothetical protein|nr:hypothetical protein [Cyclobacteriaceae bacterium]